MKYLIEIHHGIGDIVQITGVIETLYKKDSAAKIDVILLSDSRATLLKNDYRINKIYTLDIRNNSFFSLAKTIIDLRAQRYDYAFFSSISNARDANLLAILINAKMSVGEQFKFISRLTNRFVYVNNEHEHIVKRNSKLLQVAGIVEHVECPKLIINETIEIGSDKVIGICVGTSKPQKNWAIDRYIELAKHFSKKGYDIAFIGGESESKRFPLELFGEFQNWHNYMGKLSLTESAALVKSCKLIVGGDTGIMHIAAALNETTVSIFSCSDPNLHAPFSDKSYFLTANIPCQYCYGTERLLACRDYECLKGVSIAEVIDLVSGVLDGAVKDHRKFRI